MVGYNVKRMLVFLLSAAMMMCGWEALGAEGGSDREYIEQVLNLANNEDQEWTYDGEADAWTLSVVSAVAYPELPDQQGVSVCVPGAYVLGIDTVKRAEPTEQRGTAEAPNGTDLSGWVEDSDIGQVDFTLADVLAYRNSGATKAVPGFDVIDHGQENYVFGDETRDARHWNVFLNDIFQNEEYAEVLRPMFNAEPR